jgi:hypothetical protein
VDGFDLPDVVECLQKDGDTMTEQKSVREELSQDGMPELEEFIHRIVSYICINAPSGSVYPSKRRPLSFV